MSTFYAVQPKIYISLLLGIGHWALGIRHFLFISLVLLVLLVPLVSLIPLIPKLKSPQLCREGQHTTGGKFFIKKVSAKFHTT
jgi:hypothetical protein